VTLYRKKPIELEARQITLASGPDIAEWCGGTFRLGTTTEPLHTLIVPSLEGNHKGHVFDWVLKGTRGEFWVVADDIFAETYERVDYPSADGGAS
jgi:hypothetical protein